MQSLVLTTAGYVKHKVLETGTHTQQQCKVVVVVVVVVLSGPCTGTMFEAC